MNRSELFGRDVMNYNYFLFGNCRLIFVCPDNITVARAYDQLWAVDANSDLLALTDFSFGLRVIADVVLTAQFFGDAFKSGGQSARS